MKINDLRIGDIVTVKGHDFPMKVVGLFGDKDVQLLPCVEDYEGDVWEEDVADLEFCEPRYKLPAWRQPYEDKVETSTNLGAMSISYEIEEMKKDDFYLFRLINNGEGISCGRIGKYPTVAEAKMAAEKHYNEFVSEIIEKLTSAHLSNGASKTQHND